MDYWNYLYRHKELHNFSNFDIKKILDHIGKSEEKDLNPHFNLDYYNNTYGFNFQDKKEAINHFLNEGIQKGYNYDCNKNYVLKVILPTKNEEFLIDYWIKYYSKLTGFENIIILDNNSNNEKVIDVYKKYPKLFIIYTEFFMDLSKEYHIFEELIEFIKPYCKYITKLDTDEFICNYKMIDGKIDFYQNIIEELKNDSTPFIGSMWLPNEYTASNIDSNEIVDHLVFETSHLYDCINNYNTWLWRLGKKIILSKCVNLSILKLNHNCLEPTIKYYNYITFHLLNMNIERRLENNIEKCIQAQELNRKNNFEDYRDDFNYDCHNDTISHQFNELKNYFLDRNNYKKNIIHNPLTLINIPFIYKYINDQ